MTGPKPSNNASWLLTWLILAGLVVGGIIGEALFRIHDGAVPGGILEAFHFIGDTFFMGLLKMILVPLVASSVIVGVGSIGDPAQLGRLGGWTLVYYFSTMVIAVVIGIVLVTTIQPGDPSRDGSGIGGEIISEGEATYANQAGSKREHIEATGAGGLWGAFKNIASQLIPKNPLGAAANGQLLPTIAFSLIFGVVLTVIGDKGRPLADFFHALFVAIMHLVHWILWLAPVGVMALVAWTVARIGLASLVGPLSSYMVTVLVGLALHGLVVLPLILWLFGRTNPYRYLHRMRAPLMTALGTDSSSATLPVTIESAEKLGGVNPRAARFVLPLGATINMDGTALYEAVAVVFLFQAYGISLGPTELAIIVITATLAAVGAAGIPSAGLVTMVIVVESVNGSLGGAKSLPLAAVGIILGIDRILDMCRTTVNVWGDAVGAKIITRIVPD
jgi:Na+/H+-dicarboxylate symporter